MIDLYPVFPRWFHWHLKPLWLAYLARPGADLVDATEPEKYAGFSFLKAYKTYNAIYRLSLMGYVEDALILTRTLLNHCIDSLNQVRTWKESAAQYRNWSSSIASRLGRRLLDIRLKTPEFAHYRVLLESLISALGTDNVRTEGRPPSQTIRERAKHVDLELEYDVIYAFTSGLEHTDPTFHRVYQSRLAQEGLVAPQLPPTIWMRIALLESPLYFLQIARAAVDLARRNFTARLPAEEAMCSTVSGYRRHVAEAFPGTDYPREPHHSSLSAGADRQLTNILHSMGSHLEATHVRGMFVKEAKAGAITGNPLAVVSEVLLNVRADVSISERASLTQFVLESWVWGDWQDFPGYTARPWDWTRDSTAV